MTPAQLGAIVAVRGGNHTPQSQPSGTAADLMAFAAMPTA